MDGPVKFSQETLDQCVAAMKEQMRGQLGYILILVEPSDSDCPRMMVGSNMRNDLAMRCLGGAAQSLLSLERHAPGMDIDATD